MRAARGGAHAARRVPDHRRGRRRGLGDHRRRRDPGRDRDDGRARDRGGRGGGALRLPGGRRRGADRRARRARRPRSSAQFAEVERHCRDNGAFEIRIAADDAERALFWKGRKSAFAAVGRISPDYIVQDGVIPRTALPEVLRRIADARRPARGVRVANVFHAGDGNLHPLVLFDDAVPGRGRARRGGVRRDPRPVHRARRLDHRRARRRHGQGQVHAADVHRRRPRHDADAALRLRPARICPTPARSSRRRGSAARCPAGTRARTRCSEAGVAEVF